MDFGLDYTIFQLMGTSERDHGRLIKKIDQILSILPNSSKCGKGEVEPKSEWEQALLADFDLSELVDPSLDLELLELPENFMKDEPNPFFGPPSPIPVLDAPVDEDLAISSGSETETSDLRVDPEDAHCGNKRTVDTEGKEDGCETPTKRFKRTRKMSLDLEWGYCPFDNMSEAPPSMEKVDDRLSPTFEEGNMSLKGTSSALAYLQRSGSNAKKGRNNNSVNAQNEDKPEERSRKSARQQRLSSQNSGGNKRARSSPPHETATSVGSASTTKKETPKVAKSGAVVIKQEGERVGPTQPTHASSEESIAPRTSIQVTGESTGADNKKECKPVAGGLQRTPHVDDTTNGTGNGLLAGGSSFSVGTGLNDNRMAFGPNGHHVHVPKNGKCKMVGIYDPEARLARVARFHEKRRNRVWRKKIKYDCRKKLADDRPRIKGRFVKCSVPDKPAASPKTPKETSMFAATTSVAADFKYRNPGLGPSSRPLSSMLDYSMQSGHACPTNPTSRPMYRPNAATGKPTSVQAYKYPYSGPSTYNSVDGAGCATAPGFQGPNALHQRPGSIPGSGPSFAQKVTKSVYVKKKDRETAVSSKIVGNGVPSSLCKSTRIPPTGSTSQQPTPGPCAVGVSVPVYGTPSQLNTNGTGKMHGQKSVSKPSLPCFDSTVATSENEKPACAIPAKVSPSLLPVSKTQSSYAADDPVKGRQMDSANDVPLKERNVGVAKVVEGRSARSPNSTLSPPIDAMGGQATLC